MRAQVLPEEPEARHELSGGPRRRGLEWTVGRETGLRMAAALGRFWYTHGHAAEGVRWLERALSANGPPLPRGRATHVPGVLLSQRGDLARSDARLRAGLPLFRQAGDEPRRAGSLNSLAVDARERGELAAARALFEEAVSLRRRLADRKALADPLSNLGVVAMDMGDLDRAAQLLEESLAIDREYGKDRGVALNLAHLGAPALEQGDLPRVRSLLADALARLRPLGDRSSLLQALERIAGLLAAEGRLDSAARPAGAAAARREQLGEPLTATEAAIVERHPAPARDHERARAEGAELSLDEALDEAAALLK